MSNGNFDNDNDLIMGGTDEASAYNVPASLLQTFPCLMAEGREALRQQLEFVTSAVLLHPAEQGPGIDNARAIMDRSKLINDLLTTLYQTAQNLCSLDQVNLDEEYRKEIKQALDEPANTPAMGSFEGAEYAGHWSGFIDGLWGFYCESRNCLQPEWPTKLKRSVQGGSSFKHKLFSESTESIHFIKVDVDEAEDISQEYGIRAMPTFMLFKDGEKADEVVGADPGKLERLIAEHS
ncbi:hypothetical protein ACHAPI_009759 [Fusarium lateritium]